MKADSKPVGLEIGEILKLIPQAQPFLMVDRILEVVPHQRAVGIKNVSANEPYFRGHFPGNPVMPGVIMLEAILQVGSVLGFFSEPERKKEDGAFVLSMSDVKFRRKVVPGDVLTVTVEVLHIRGAIWKIKGKAEVDGELAASGIFVAGFEG